MIRSRAIIAIAMAVAALSAASACAQSESPSSGRSRERTSGPSDAATGGLSLLQIDSVQRDLHLTDEQRVAILQLRMDMRQSAASNVVKRLNEILTPEQTQRLKQIRLQVEGPAALNSPEVAQALKLTEAQRSKLTSLQNQFRMAVREVFESVRKLTSDERQARRNEIMERLDEARKETVAKSMAVLTPQQCEKLNEMQGKKIDLDAPPPSRKTVDLSKPIVPQKAPDKSTDKPTEKTSDATPEKVEEKAGEKTPEKSPEKTP
jgi:Spy/CpxP family protein refolding chaperone